MCQDGGGVLVEENLDAAIGYESLAFLHRVRIDILEHLEPVFALSYYGPQGYGYGQSYHSGAGNPDTHGVLEHVGAKANLDFLRACAKQFGGFGYRQCYRHGFRTAHCGHHLAAYECDNVFALLFG